jgi:hypothetical protein
MIILKNLFSKKNERNDLLFVQEHLESFEAMKKIKIILREKFSLRKKAIAKHNEDIISSRLEENLFLGFSTYTNDKFIFKTYGMKKSDVELLYPVPSLKLLKVAIEDHTTFYEGESIKEFSNFPPYIYRKPHALTFGLQRISYWEINRDEKINYGNEFHKEKKEFFDLISHMERLQQKSNDVLDDKEIQFHLVKHQSSFERVLNYLLELVENSIPLSDKTEVMLEDMFKDFGQLISKRITEIEKNNEEFKILENEAKQKSITEIVQFEREFQKKYLL